MAEVSLPAALSARVEEILSAACIRFEHADRYLSLSLWELHRSGAFQERLNALLAVSDFVRYRNEEYYRRDA